MKRYRMAWRHATQDGMWEGAGQWEWARDRRAISRLERSIAFGNRHHGLGSHWIEEDHGNG